MGFAPFRTGPFQPRPGQVVASEDAPFLPRRSGWRLPPVSTCSDPKILPCGAARSPGLPRGVVTLRRFSLARSRLWGPPVPGSVCPRKDSSTSPLLAPARAFSSFRRMSSPWPPGLRSISPEGSISHCRAPRFPSSPSTSRPCSAFESVAGFRRLSLDLPDPPLGLGSLCCPRSERCSMRSCRSVRALIPGVAGHLSERPVSFVPKDSRSSGSCPLPVRWPKSSLLGRTGWSTSLPFRATP